MFTHRKATGVRRGESAGRKLAAPERLEPRNAPGALAPLHPLGTALEASRDQVVATGEVDGATDLDKAERSIRLTRLPGPALGDATDDGADGAQRQAAVRQAEPTSRPLERPAFRPLLAAGFDDLGTLGSALSGGAAIPPANFQSLQLPRPYAPVISSLGGPAALPTATGTGPGGGDAGRVPQLAGGAEVSSAALSPSLAADPSAAAALEEEAPPLPDTSQIIIWGPAPLDPVDEELPTFDFMSTPASLLSNASFVSTMDVPGQISAAEVDLLLERAVRATNRNDAIIAIVDRHGRILGVQVEAGVGIADQQTLAFAIDGAVAKARTAAFFSNDQAVLTSRTVRFISQTTITQREVQSNPNDSDPLKRGPGFVAPIGLGGHFPPDVTNTPPVDLFAIEHTNRDSIVHPGADRVKAAVTLDDDGRVETASMTDKVLQARFGADFAANKEILAPESYGFVSEKFTENQGRGIATLPGGVPLYKFQTPGMDRRLVGAIGVFFPGVDGYATHEQNFIPGVGQSTNDRTNAPLVLEAEYTAALVAVNGGAIGGLPPLPDFTFPKFPEEIRIDLVGITLEGIGPHPMTPPQFLATPYTQATTSNGIRMPVTPAGAISMGGIAVPEGWLVLPRASTAPGGLGLTAAEVQDIILRGVNEANLVRAAIRLPLGTRTKMVLSVTDLDGTVLGLYRMPDATFFSIDVAVAKARNVTYYAGPSLQPPDRVDVNNDGAGDLPLGVAFTNRTFRFLAEPRFPAGIDPTPGDFSTLLVDKVDPLTAENKPGMTPTVADFNQSVLGFDAFNPGTNFHDPTTPAERQNGVVFFPGSTPLYRGTTLLGGLGVSGDGVDQDDVVTFVAAGSFLPRTASPIVRADEVFVSGVRLPYQKFLRNPHG